MITCAADIDALYDKPPKKKKGYNLVFKKHGLVWTAVGTHGLTEGTQYRVHRRDGSNTLITLGPKMGDTPFGAQYHIRKFHND